MKRLLYLAFVCASSVCMNELQFEMDPVVQDIPASLKPFDLSNFSDANKQNLIEITSNKKNVVAIGTIGKRKRKKIFITTQIDDTPTSDHYLAQYKYNSELQAIRFVSLIRVAHTDQPLKKILQNRFRPTRLVMATPESE